jgi:hypothetical protein
MAPPRLALGVLLVSVGLLGCGSSGSQTHSTATASTPAVLVTVQTLPHIGAVIVERGRHGTVMLDRATNGKHFVLTGIQASECRSFLAANPKASKKDVLAACPGSTVARAVAATASHSQ